MQLAYLFSWVKLYSEVISCADISKGPPVLQRAQPFGVITRRPPSCKQFTAGRNPLSDQYSSEQKLAKLFPGTRCGNFLNVVLQKEECTNNKVIR